MMPNSQKSATPILNQQSPQRAPPNKIQISNRGWSVVFEPLEDITAKESTLIFQLIFLLHGGADLDPELYILRHDLNRHFVHLEQPQTKGTSP